MLHEPRSHEPILSKIFRRSPVITISIATITLRGSTGRRQTSAYLRFRSNRFVSSDMKCCTKSFYGHNRIPLIDELLVTNCSNCKPEPNGPLNGRRKCALPSLYGFRRATVKYLAWSRWRWAMRRRQSQQKCSNLRQLNDIESGRRSTLRDIGTTSRSGCDTDSLDVTKILRPREGMLEFSEATRLHRYIKEINYTESQQAAPR